MKKAILIMLAVLAIQPATAAPAAMPFSQPEEPTTYTVVLAGGSAENMIHIWLSADGRTYVIDSIVPLEVGGEVCENPAGNSNELICQAPIVAGFEVNAGPGNDRVTVGPTVTIPVTLRGGLGRDMLGGASGADKLIGGAGDDRLIGHGGDDVLFGGPGDDVLFGGPGDDVLRGGPGDNVIRAGNPADDPNR